MIMTLTDNHTKNPDECVTIEAEFITHYEEAKRTISALGRNTYDSHQQLIAKQFTAILEEDARTVLNPRQQPMFVIKVIGKPFIVVRGIQISTNELLFKAVYRTKYVGHDPQYYPETTVLENVERGYEYYWHIDCIAYQLTAHQQEQLVLRYQEDILKVVQDEEMHDLIRMYSNDRFLTIMQGWATKEIYKLSTVLEYIEEAQEDLLDDEGEE